MIMSEIQASNKPDDRDRFDQNPAIASGHLVSENAVNKIIPTHIGDEKYTLSGKMTNDSLLPTNTDDENHPNQGLSQAELGWETSEAIPLHSKAHKEWQTDMDERREAAKSLHKKHLEEAKGRGFTESPT